MDLWNSDTASAYCQICALLARISRTWLPPMITLAMNLYIGSYLVTYFGLSSGRLPIKPEVSVVEDALRESEG
jgi:hypothetical protein